MTKRVLLLIFLLALFLRVYKLGSYPVGLLWDEAALGYNAYSILKTGKDEYGKFLPLIFKSFGDYKPGFYIYLTTLPVGLFGLNEFTVRLPSAFFGSLTVLVFYLLIKEAGREFNQQKEVEKLALISAALLAFNPWHLNFSRGAWELNVMTFEILVALWLAEKFFNTKKNFWLYLSCFFAILTLFTYQSAKLLVPLLLLGWLFFWRQKIKKIEKKPIIISSGVFLLVFLLFSFVTVFKGMSGRIKVMSLFSYPRAQEESQIIQSQDNYSTFTWNIFHSSPIFFTRSFLGRFFNHFSGKFLFFYGDWSNPRNGIVNHGVLYLIDIFFLLWGLGVIFGKKRSGLENLMLFWLILAPVPSALTRDIISSVRSFTMVIPLIFIIATGILDFAAFLQRQKRIVQYSLFAILFLSYSFFFIRFLDLYFVHDPIFASKDHLYGYKEMVNFVKPLAEAKNKVVITTSYGQPYIFWLFYTKYNPEKYQKAAFLKENPYGDVGEVERLDNIEFRKIYWPADRGIKNSLFVGDEFDLPLQDIVGQPGITFLKEIKFLNGNTAFRIVETH